MPLSAALGGRSCAARPGFRVVLTLFLVSRVHLLGCLGQNVGVVGVHWLLWLVLVGLLDHRQDCPVLDVRAGGAGRQELFRLFAVMVIPVLLENLQIKKDFLEPGQWVDIGKCLGNPHFLPCQSQHAPFPPCPDVTPQTCSTSCSQPGTPSSRS